MEKLNVRADDSEPAIPSGLINVVNQLIDSSNSQQARLERIEQAVSLVAKQLDYVTWGHNNGITREDEHYIEISPYINSILKD